MVQELEEEDKVDVARILLEEGADVNASRFVRNFRLFLAIILHNMIFHPLLNHTFIKAIQGGWTPLQYARSESVARLLLEYGANPNARDEVLRSLTLLID